MYHSQNFADTLKLTSYHLVTNKKNQDGMAAAIVDHIYHFYTPDIMSTPSTISRQKVQSKADFCGGMSRNPPG